TGRNSFASFSCALLLPISCIISRSRHAKDVDSDLHHRAVTRSAPDSTRPRLLSARCIGPRAAQSKSWLRTQRTSNETTGLSGQRYRVCMAILCAGRGRRNDETLAHWPCMPASRRRASGSYQASLCDCRRAGLLRWVPFENPISGRLTMTAAKSRSLWSACLILMSASSAALAQPPHTNGRRPHHGRARERAGSHPGRQTEPPRVGRSNPRREILLASFERRAVGERSASSCCRGKLFHSEASRDRAARRFE